MFWKTFYRIFWSLFLCFFSITLNAQDTVAITVKADAGKDMIRLRWVANSPSAWYYTNKNGVLIERYTLMRNGKVLDNPEKIQLTPVPLKPHPLNDWESVAKKDNYAAIIAQALYGNDFEVSGGQKNISEIIALSQEQEQRYAMSMLAAGMSFPAALFAGWGYEDRSVNTCERYLYRVIPVCPDKKKHIETGSAYAGLDDYRELPRPLELNAVWGNQSVLLTWNSKILEQYYTSYYLERSGDGIHFNRTSNTPLINVTGNDRMFFNDTIVNGKTYYYRLFGLTSFNEEGPVSDTIQGKGIPKLIYHPGITKAFPDDSGGVEVSWHFDEKGNNDLTGFELRRGDTDKGPFMPVVSGIPPASRMTVYEKPMPENYLVIAAIPKEGEENVSFPFMLQMEDSVPPLIPQGLEGHVDTLGAVRLKWTANTDADLLGYRIYRGQAEGEELIPLTDIAVKTNEYRDSVNLYNLNARVYYAVTALDKRYNQSALSATLALEKPDMIKPSPPFITKCEATGKGIQLEWVPGREILHSYLIFRKEKGERDLLQTIASPDITSYLDSTVAGGITYAYDIVSVNRRQLESVPSPAMTVTAKGRESGIKITRIKGERTEKGILLKWEHAIPDVKSAVVYRKEGEAPLSSWRGLETWERETLDASAKRNVVYEYLLIIKNRNGVPASATVKIN